MLNQPVKGVHVRHAFKFHLHRILFNKPPSSPPPSPPLFVNHRWVLGLKLRRNIRHGSKGVQAAARLKPRTEHTQSLGSQWPLFSPLGTAELAVPPPWPQGGPPADGDSSTCSPASFSPASGSPGLVPRRRSIVGGRGQAGHTDTSNPLVSLPPASPQK